MARRTIRKLTPGERADAQWMLADGVDPASVAKRLGVDVRSLNGLLDSPVVRELSDVDRLELVCRNAWVQYERSRAFGENLRRGLPELHGSESRRESDYRRVISEAARQHQLAADRHLRTYLEAALAIAKIGGGDSGREFPGLHLSVDSGELGDRPQLAGEAVSDDDGDADGD